MELSIEIFLSIIAFCMIMAVIGIWKRIPFLMLIGGAIIAFTAVITDTLIMGQFTSPDGLSSILSYHVISRTGQDDIRTLNSEIQAEFASTSSSQLVGDVVNCATWNIKKSGTPDFNTLVRYGVWDNSAVPVLKYTFGTMNVTAVPTTVQPVQLCNNDSTYTIISNDRIGIGWNDGNATNRVTVDVDTTNPFDGTITFNTRFNGASWISNTGTDMQGDLSLQTGTSAMTINETLPFTEYPKILFGLIGSMILMGGALIWKMDD